MNRLFLLVAFLVLGKISYSQYPLTQNLGSDSTIVVSKGALQSRLIPIVVSDTNAANAQRMKSYPGAQLFTTNGNFYYRNSTATKWILVSSGSAGPVNIYNTDGTLTGNRILTGAGNSLYFDGISGLGINTPYDSLLTVDGGIHATGGLRVEKLTTSPGTKALRIDGQGVVSVADTSGGTVTSIATNNGTGITGGTITTSGTLAIDTTLISTRAWRQKGIDSVANLPRVTSVGLTMPAAFNVAGSPVTSSGTLAVTAAGLSTQYIRGDGQLANFPGGGGGGGSSVVYYFNGGTNQGTFVGNTYYEMSKTAIVGTAANFTINADGYITQFITDAGDPALLNIPAGNWNFEMYFSASSGGGSPSFYVELYKYDGTTFTLISSSSSSPEGITGGTATDLYLTALAVPATSLTLTDRLAVRVYVTHSGRTITLHTQDNTLCQVTTTFTTGITALNGLTDQVQYFATGTSGTDFNISSASATHTFNLPTASATNRGALSSSDWTTFNSKISPSDTASMLAPYLRKADTTAMLANYVNNVGYGLSKAGQVVSADSSTLANYFLRRKDSLTSTNLLGYVTRTVLADTAAAIRASAGTIGGSGTTNRVSKFTASGTIGNSSIEDSSASVAMTIRSNGNVGIGIAAPDSMFAVSQGSLFQRGVRMSGLPSAPGTKALRIDANGTLSIADTTTGGGGGTIGGSGTTNYLPKFTASTTLGDSRLFDNGTVTFLGNGDVNATPSTGIFSGTGGTGTNIAGAELRIRGGASTGNAAGGIISFYTSAAGTSGSATNAATERMRLDANGNLGLGVVPSASWASGYRAFEFGNTSTQQGFLFSNGINDTWLGSNSIFNGSNWTRIGTGFATGYEQVSGEHTWQYAASGSAGTTFSFTVGMRLNASGNLGINTSTIGSRLQVNGNAAIGYSASTAAPTNGLAVSGNVGIGTNSPSGRLDLSSSSDNYLNILTSGAASAAVLNMFNSVSGGDGAAIGYNIALRFGTVTGVNAAGFTERMRITGGGTVIVGNGETAGTPSTGIISGTGGTGTNIAGAEFRIRGGASTGSGAGGPITFYTSAAGSAGTGVNAATERMRLDASGNLGLGVTPSAWWSSVNAFQILGASLLSSGNTSSLTANAFLNNTPQWIYRNTAAATHYEQTLGEHRWFNAPSGTAGNTITFTQAMTLNASGNLGINTTTIGSRLQVNGNAAIGYSASTAAPTNGLLVAGNARASGMALFGFASGTSGGNLELGWDGSQSVVQSYNRTSNGFTTLANYGSIITFNIGSTERMRLDASGNLGIQTSTIGSRLQVNGNAAIGYSASTAAPTNGLAVAGNAGFGTTTPGYTAASRQVVAINGGSAAAQGSLLAFMQAGVNKGYVWSYQDNMEVWCESGSLTLGNNAAASIIIKPNNTDRLTVTSGGQVTLATGSNVSAIAQTGYSLTGANAQSLIDLAGTWNTTGNPTAIKLNITNTASGASADLMELQVGGVNQFVVTKDGVVGIGATSPSNGRLHIDPSDNETALIVNGTSVTGSSSTNLIDLSQTWNTTGTPTAIKLNVTNTASGASSYLMDLQLGSSNRFRVLKGGTTYVSDGTVEVYLDPITSFGVGVVGTSSNHGLSFAANGGIYATLQTTGEFWVNNNTDQGAYNLQVGGTGVWGAGAYVNGSDSAVKTNIQPLESSLEVIKQMKPVTFEYKPFYSKDSSIQTGFIAQDLQQLLADKIYKNGVVKEGGQYLGVAYETIIPLLVKAIQEQQQQIDQLKSQINK